MGRSMGRFRLILLVAMVAAIATIAVSAKATVVSPDNQISGVITLGAGGHAALPVALYYQPDPSSDFSMLSTTECDAGTGAYSFDISSPGTYKVLAACDADTGGYRYQGWHSQWSSPLVSDYTDEFGDITGFSAVNFTVSKFAGSISGVVTANYSNAALSGVDVAVYRWNGAWWEQYPLDTAVTTDVLGHYTVPNLDASTEAGNWIVGFSTSGYADVFWPDATSPDGATGIAVGTTPVTGENVAMDSYSTASSISGNVHFGAINLQNVPVLLYKQDPDTSAWDPMGEPQLTNSGGGYTFDTLSPGYYKVSFNEGAVIGFNSQWWNNKANLGGADRIGLDGTNAAGSVSATLTPYAGSISGTVTVSYTNAPVSGVSVVPYYFDGASWVAAELPSPVLTDANGHYTLAGLKDGQWRVGFFKDNYTSPFWPNAADVDSAASIGVSGAAVSGKGVVLDSYSFDSMIGGTARFASAGVGSVSVNLYKQDPDTHVYEPYDDDSTAPGGSYSFTGLAAGYYKVVFERDSVYGFRPQWWNNKASLAAADPIAIDGTNSRASIDANLTKYTGSIAGKTTNAYGGANLASVTVTVFDGYSTVAETQTGGDGRYLIDHIADGTYQVYFDKDPFNPQFWNGKSAYGETPDDVVVASGGATTNVNAALLASVSSIEGTVSLAATKVSVPITLFIEDQAKHTWSVADTGLSDAQTGTYGFFNLPGGQYRVGFASDSRYYYRPQWWRNRSLEASADTVALDGTDTTVSVNAAMSLYAGSIDGTATVWGTTAPLAGVTVSIESTSGEELTSTVTAGNGKYSVGYLADGPYIVSFSKDSYESQRFMGLPLGDVTNFAVVANQGATHNVNARMEANASSITGTVTISGTGKKADTWVGLYKQDPATGRWSTTTTTPRRTQTPACTNSGG